MSSSPKPSIDFSNSAYFAREGLGLHRWVNDKTAGGTDPAVLTDATLVYNLPEGHQVFINAVDFDMATVSDDVHFDLVSCSAINGGGTPTALAGHAHIFTGATIDGSASKERSYDPPIRVRYSDGAEVCQFASQRTTPTQFSAVVGTAGTKKSNYREG